MLKEKFIFVFCEESPVSIDTNKIDHVLVIEDAFNLLVFNKYYNNIVKSLLEDLKYLTNIYDKQNITFSLNIKTINCFKFSSNIKWGNYDNIENWKIVNHPNIDEIRKGVIKLLMIQ